MNTQSLVISPVNLKARQTLDLRSGDTVRVHQKVQEKGKTRSQIFEGLVIARKHGREAGGTFTVRKVSSGVGVERIFPLYSPAIEKVEIISRSRPRRAKLYYIRDKAAREIRRKMKQLQGFEKIRADLSAAGEENAEPEKETVENEKLENAEKAPSSSSKSKPAASKKEAGK